MIFLLIMNSFKLKSINLIFISKSRQLFLYRIECEQVFPPNINNYDFYQYLANNSTIMNNLL